jgi:N6-adenosine-specific RNA methylase IME4
MAREAQLVQLPANYVAARSALALAVRVDEAKDIRDQAVALKVYAYQAKNPELAAYAAEITLRATRRVGELLKELKAAGKLAKGAAGNPGGRGAKIVRVAERPAQTLGDQGVDKHLADKARKLAAMPEEKFEAATDRAGMMASAAALGDREVIKAARAAQHKGKQEKRAANEAALADKIAALPAKRFGVILADPEWKFGFWAESGKDISSADNHYPTSPLSEIKARDVPSIAADDCVLFLWATAPMMQEALEVMAAWGFAYKSQFVWVKHKMGTGYWARNQHELLLLGTRGHVPAPAPGDQWSSVIAADVGVHSAKPEAAHRMIEAYFPTLPKIELNRRGPAREGWDAWGLEAEAAVGQATT